MEASRGLGLALAGLALVASTAGAQAPPPAAPVTTRVGRVEKVDKRVLVIDLGSNDGIGRGDSVEIATRDGSVVVQVMSALPDSARTIRPIGAEVEEGAAVRLTAARATVTRSVPARPSYFGFDTRLFGLASASVESGGGILTDIRMRYRASIPLEVQARLSPVGFGFGSIDRVSVGHGELGLGYDHLVFGFGVTIGATVTEVEDDGGFGSYRTTLGFSTGVNLRLGARDGLFAEIGVSYGYTPNGFEWVYARFDGMVPVGTGFWLVFTASGGRTRHGMGSIGFRALLRGGGGAGSLFLTGYFGGGGILRPGLFDSYAGPLLGLGIEARY